MTHLSEFNDFSNEVDDISVDIISLNWLFGAFISAWGIKFDDSFGRKDVIEGFTKSIEKWSIRNYTNRPKIEEEIEENLCSFGTDSSEYAYLCKIDKLVENWETTYPELLDKLEEVAEYYNIKLSYKHIAQIRLSQLRNMNNSFLRHKDILQMYATQYDQIPSECLDLENVSDLAKLALFYLYDNLINIALKFEQVKQVVTHSLLATQHPTKFPNLFNSTINITSVEVETTYSDNTLTAPQQFLLIRLLQQSGLFPQKPSNTDEAPELRGIALLTGLSYGKDLKGGKGAIVKVNQLLDLRERRSITPQQLPHKFADLAAVENVARLLNAEPVISAIQLIRADLEKLR